MVNIISWANCTTNKPLSYYFNTYIRFWCPPPQTLLDLTFAKGRSIQGLINVTLTGDRYRIIKHDIDPLMPIDLIGDLRFPAFKKACCDILYIDPPYCTTKGRYSLNSKRTLGKTGLILQYEKGLDTFKSILKSLKAICCYLLKPQGTLLFKIQPRQFLPHIDPIPFKIPLLLEPELTLHDYMIYTYHSLRPTLPVFTDAKRTKLSHGYLMNFVLND